MGKNITIIILSIACAWLLWLRFANPVVFPADQIINQRLDSIASENNRLKKAVAGRESQIEWLEAENDSLNYREKGIKGIYQKIYEKNHNLPANDLAHEFERIFAEHHIE